MKKLNSRTRAEQIFVLLLLSTVCFCAFLATGCGGDASCETIKCGMENDDGYWIGGCSIPGCGGCLSPEKGCDSCIWPQSCKIAAGAFDDEEDGSLKVAALDIRYYGDGCLGCGQREKACYSGFHAGESEYGDVVGCFYGGSGSDEQIIGCFDGCFGCIGTEGLGFQEVQMFEQLLGID